MSLQQLELFRASRSERNGHGDNTDISDAPPTMHPVSMNSSSRNRGPIRRPPTPKKTESSNELKEVSKKSSKKRAGPQTRPTASFVQPRANSRFAIKQRTNLSGQVWTLLYRNYETGRSAPHYDLYGEPKADVLKQTKRLLVYGNPTVEESPRGEIDGLLNRPAERKMVRKLTTASINALMKMFGLEDKPPKDPEEESSDRDEPLCIKEQVDIEDEERYIRLTRAARFVMVEKAEQIAKCGDLFLDDAISTLQRCQYSFFHAIREMTKLIVTDENPDGNMDQQSKKISSPIPSNNSNYSVYAMLDKERNGRGKKRGHSSPPTSAREKSEKENRANGRQENNEVTAPPAMRELVRPFKNPMGSTRPRSSSVPSNGSPIGAIDENQPPTTEKDQASTPQLPEKRGPGRPRKLNLDGSVKQSAPEPQEKRPRSRPRKLNPDGSVKQSTPQPKRARGRPRKLSLDGSTVSARSGTLHNSSADEEPEESAEEPEMKPEEPPVEGLRKHTEAVVEISELPARPPTLSLPSSPVETSDDEAEWEEPRGESDDRLSLSPPSATSPPLREQMASILRECGFLLDETRTMDAEEEIEEQHLPSSDHSLNRQPLVTRSSSTGRPSSLPHYSRPSTDREGPEQENLPPASTSTSPPMDSQLSDKQILRSLFAQRGVPLVNMDRIGSGRYSKVMTAGMNDGSTIAIKIINTAEVTHDFRTKFLPREIECWEKLRHPNLIKLLDRDECGGRVFLFMEYGQGGDMLAHVQKNGPVHEATAVLWMRQIISGISYMHNLNIVHRDLKLENIIIFSATTVKIADFGFARRMGNDPSETFCGSKLYAAPEILSGQPYNPYKADVWSMGVITYVIVTGQMPFLKSMPSAEFIYAQRGRLYMFPLKLALSVECRDTIDGLLEADPENRPSISESSRMPWFVMSPTPSVE